METFWAVPSCWQFPMAGPRTPTAPAAAIHLAILVPQLTQPCVSDIKARQLARDPVFLKLTLRAPQIYRNLKCLIVFSGKKTESLKNHMTSIELRNIRLGLATKKTNTDSVDSNG
jgi:hypothetical protein